jgi:hypothetical protein
MVARLSPTSTLDLAAHALRIERNRGGAWSLLPSGGSVRPEEPIRFTAASGPGLSTWVDFSVLDAAGATVLGPEQVTGNLAGNAWLDATAPIDPGTYTVLAESRRGLSFRGTHPQTRQFRVDPRAAAAPGGGFEWPDVGDLVGNPWSIALILAALLAIGIMI